MADRPELEADLAAYRERLAAKAQVQEALMRDLSEKLTKRIAADAKEDPLAASNLRTFVGREIDWLKEALSALEERFAECGDLNQGDLEFLVDVKSLLPTVTPWIRRLSPPKESEIRGEGSE